MSNGDHPGQDNYDTDDRVICIDCNKPFWLDSCGCVCNECQEAVCPDCVDEHTCKNGPV